MGTQPAEAALRVGPDRLVVAVYRDGHTDLWVVDGTDGHLISRLTNTPKLDEYPGGWAPRGGWFAFARGRAGDCDLYLRSTKSGEVSVLRHEGANEMSPAWAPDGRSIAFIRRGGASDEVEVARRDGTILRTLPFPPGSKWGLTWSTHDLVAVVVYSDDPDVKGIWVARSDGSHLRRIAGSEDWTAMDWSPDGRWLLASRPGPHDDRKNQLILARPDGTDRRVVYTAEAVYAARFQPNSKAIFLNAPSEPVPLWVWVYKVPVSGSGGRLLVSLKGHVWLDSSPCF